MIRVENIKKQFGEQEVLKGISTVFEEGKTNLIIGKSGAGKTVMLKILVGLLQPTSGHIWYGNTNFTQLSNKQRKAIRTEMGMLFQGSALFDSMTVEQNVRFPLDMFTKLTAKEKRIRVDETLERVELGGANNKYPSEISGGMQKRVGIARAIILKPKFLFCDEPNSGLDPTTSMRIDELIHQITVENQMTTVINTHDMNSVMEIGDKINLLYFGELAWVGNCGEVMGSDNELLQDFIFASPFLQRLRDSALKNGH
ncbi:ATP-binding cassette domain-containing protein [Saprospira sp. CCB-QB6]|uniref:ABC transporter ATP-binding protein n=1 Tax=Saprospira sp. CCB-QB6 TaxID=3023936 RepID=UPI00234B2F15|nr:ATP-binding cassette domain-containing protein [Saprospira sp. CCB-QB6]WCL81992.1 ATP-binding cassette domain-containing protein [Saprospira sp. CCB-QB6]